MRTTVELIRSCPNGYFYWGSFIYIAKKSIELLADAETEAQNAIIKPILDKNIIFLIFERGIDSKKKEHLKVSDSHGIYYSRRFDFDTESVIKNRFLLQEIINLHSQFMC